jgi:hypothetical protein
MGRIDDGKHVCPFMTTNPSIPAVCIDICALLQYEINGIGEKHTYCGMVN